MSGGRADKIGVIRDCLTRMEELTHKTYAMVVDWDITSPMRAVTDSENLIYKQRTTDCDVALSVVELRRKSYFNMVKKQNTDMSK